MHFRFLHAADLHLDSPFEGLAHEDPALRETLLDASLSALDALVDRAIDERVLFVALAGDVYDGAERGIRAQLRLLEATRRLDQAGIWTFIAHGNHDPVERGWNAVREWPAKVVIFPGDRASTHRLTAADGTPVTVSGTSFPERRVLVGLHSRFEVPREPGFHVAVLHASVDGNGEHEPYSPCRLQDLVDLDFDAWLLGHIHKRQILRPQAPFVAYPGNLQGRSFKPSEQGPKGALLVEVEGREVRARLLELGPVRFEAFEQPVTDADGVDTLVDALVEAVRARLGGAQRLLARARVSGVCGELHRLLSEGDPAELERALRDRLGALPVHWDGFEFDVRPPIDRAALRERGDLAGALVAELERWHQNPVELQGLLLSAAGTKELAGLAAAELAELAEQAADLALGLLEGEA
jgi:DNA repair exonuclease SbcCD nuclease subunit